MALLSAAQKTECLDRVMRQFHDRGIATGNTKPDWRILITALDTALDTESVTLNGYIPQPQRANFTTQEKALAMEIVVALRYLI